jgi:HlyD family secretion protein
MDVPRSPEVLRRKKLLRVAASGAGLLTLVLVTIGLSHLKPAAPSVERATVWIDTVKRGPMLRQVRGLGTLVPEEIRWIPATTQGRVERIVTQPGSPVEPDTVVLELSNPELELQALDAQADLRAAEAAYTELKVRLQSQRTDQEAAAPACRAEVHQARADTDEALARARPGRAEPEASRVRRGVGQPAPPGTERLGIGGEAVEAQLAVQRAGEQQSRHGAPGGARSTP